MLIKLNPEFFRGTTVVLAWLVNVKLPPSLTDPAEAAQFEERDTAEYPSDPPKRGIWNANSCVVGAAEAGAAVTNEAAPTPSVPSNPTAPTVAHRVAVDLNARMERSPLLLIHRGPQEPSSEAVVGKPGTPNHAHVDGFPACEPYCAASSEGSELHRVVSVPLRQAG